MQRASSFAAACLLLVLLCSSTARADDPVVEDYTKMNEAELRSAGARVR
jgi:hypothetical protein